MCVSLFTALLEKPDLLRPAFASFDAAFDAAKDSSRAVYNAPEIVCQLRTTYHIKNMCDSEVVDLTLEDEPKPSIAGSAQLDLAALAREREARRRSRGDDGGGDSKRARTAPTGDAPSSRDRSRARGARWSKS